MNPEPTRRFLNAAIVSMTEGDSRKYLREAAELNWTANEKTIRRDCAELRRRALEPGVCDLAHHTLKGINGFYRTRLALRHLPRMSQVLFDTVNAAGWWRGTPPNLLECPETDLESLTSLVQRVLKQFADDRLPRPYSLITKWAHFCFPETFVIYDARAAASVQTWSYFTYSLGDSAGSRFLGPTTANPDNPDGSGYRGFLDFYRLCWQHATPKQRARLVEAASEMSAEIGAPVSVIDVIDKLLWIAAGDPRKMGLL